MNKILKMLAVVGLIVIIAGMVASIHFSGLYQQSMFRMQMGQGDLNSIKENIKAVYANLRLTILSQRAAMGGCILLATSLLGLVLGQEKRIREIEIANKAFQAIGDKSPQPER